MRVVVRRGPKVSKHDAADLAAALDVAERAAREIAGRPPRPRIEMIQRRYEPIAQVMGRVEIRGRGGLDVRGDGSVEAWTGSWRRRVVEQRDGETPYAALRRALASGSTSAGP